MALYFRDNISGSTLFFADHEASLTPVFSIDSVSAGPYYEGDTVTLQVSNANASGKTLAIPAGALTVTAQDANSMSFVVPDLKTFGDRTGRYNSQITLTATDTGVTSTIQLTISPLAGHDYTGTIALSGIHAPAYAPGAATNDNAYGYFVTGTGTSNLAAGAIQSDAGATYRVWYQDESDGVWSSSYADHVIDGSADTTNPVITLLGDNPVIHAHGATFNEPGYAATDNADGVITDNVVVTGAVNSNVIGSYILRYNVSDSAGNDATEVTRTVNVVDQAAPVMALNGSSIINLALGQAYNELGATAIDAVDGNLTAFISIESDVDVDTAGSYTVTYSATDAAGNTGAIGRTVNVSVDSTAPVITLVGDNPVTHPQGTAYSDAGATASDNADGDISADIITTGASFNANVVGSYTVRYNVSDSAGNQATEITRTVNVVDQINPVINVTPSSLSIIQGSAYTDSGVTATDNNDGDITGSIVTTGSVDVNTLGSYTLSYSVTDAAGNVGTASRVVTVAAATPEPEYSASKEQVRIARNNNYILFHDSSSIPTSSPKDPNSIIWKGFTLAGLEDDETLLSASFLIDGVQVSDGDTVNGLTFLESQDNGIDQAKAKLSGGTEGATYRLTMRYSTEYVPSDDRSQDFLVTTL